MRRRLRSPGRMRGPVRRVRDCYAGRAAGYVMQITRKLRQPDGADAAESAVVFPSAAAGDRQVAPVDLLLRPLFPAQRLSRLPAPMGMPNWPVSRLNER